MMHLHTQYTLSTGHFWDMRPVHLPAIGLGLLLLFLSPATASAQGDWDLGFTAGMSNYWATSETDPPPAATSSGTFRNCGRVLPSASLPAASSTAMDCGGCAATS